MAGPDGCQGRTRGPRRGSWMNTETVNFRLGPMYKSIRCFASTTTNSDMKIFSQNFRHKTTDVL